MTNSLTLTNASLSTSTAVKLLNGEFTYGWKNLVKADPGNGYFGDVEAQFNGWENPIASLMFHIPTDNIPAGTMTWPLWNEFVKAQHAGSSSSCTFLAITYGASDTAFAEYSASSSSTARTTIPVQISSYNLRFSPAESKNAAHWTISAQLQVTKTT